MSNASDPVGVCLKCRKPIKVGSPYFTICFSIETYDENGITPHFADQVALWHVEHVPSNYSISFSLITERDDYNQILEKAKRAAVLAHAPSPIACTKCEKDLLIGEPHLNISALVEELELRNNMINVIGDVSLGAYHPNCLPENMFIDIQALNKYPEFQNVLGKFH